MGRCVGWLVLDSQLKLTFSFYPVTVPAKLNKRQRGVRFSECVVHLERLHRRFFRFWESFLWLMHAVDHLHVVTVSQTGIRSSVVWVLAYRLLKVVYALGQSFRRALVP